MTTLESLSAHALARPAEQPAIEFEREWRTWGEMRRVASRLAELTDASGVPRDAPIAFVPRNRPSAIAALLGLISQGRTVRMLYAFQSSAALAHDVERLGPAMVVAAAEDYSHELLTVLQAGGAAAISLEEMDAAALAGLERSSARAAAPAAAAPAAAPPRIELLTSGTTGPPKRFA